MFTFISTAVAAIVLILIIVYWLTPGRSSDPKVEAEAILLASKELEKDKKDQRSNAVRKRADEIKEDKLKDASADFDSRYGK